MLCICAYAYVLAQTACAFNASVSKEAGISDGSTITKDAKNYLFDYCGKNNIAPEHLEFAFRKLYGKQLLEARDKKIIANYSARKQKIKDAEIISGGASKVGNFAPTGDAKSKLKATFERILGKQ